MRPTRWTREQRRTKRGKGGWSIYWSGGLMFSYVHPLSGHGYVSDSLGDLIKTRRRTEQAGGMPPDEMELTGPLGSLEMSPERRAQIRRYSKNLRRNK